MSSRPTFTISLDDLKQLARSVAELKNNAKLLGTLMEGATDHQLNCTVGGASAIIVKPREKPARFTLRIGAFHREGELEAFSSCDIDEAIKRIEVLQERVVQKAAGTTKA